MADEFSIDNSKKEFLWDLRARRENFIAGLIDQSIFYRTNNDYYKTFQLLKILFDYSCHMYLDKRGNENLKKEYDEKIKNINALAEKYENTWTKKNVDKNEDGIINDALAELTWFLIQNIENAGGFGSRRKDATDYSAYR